MQDKTRSLNLEMKKIQNKVGVLEYCLSQSNIDEIARLEKEINVCWSSFGNLANNVQTFISVSGLEINLADARDESEADNSGALLEDERIKQSFIRFAYIHIKTQNISLIQTIPKEDISETGERRENGKEARK